MHRFHEANTLVSNTMFTVYYMFKGLPELWLSKNITTI